MIQDMNKWLMRIPTEISNELRSEYIDVSMNQARLVLKVTQLIIKVAWLVSYVMWLFIEVT